MNVSSGFFVFVLPDGRGCGCLVIRAYWDLQGAR